MAGLGNSCNAPVAARVRRCAGVGRREVDAAEGTGRDAGRGPEVAAGQRVVPERQPAPQLSAGPEARRATQ